MKRSKTVQGIKIQIKRLIITHKISNDNNRDKNNNTKIKSED